MKNRRFIKQICFLNVVLAIISFLLIPYSVYAEESTSDTRVLDVKDFKSFKAAVQEYKSINTDMLIKVDNITITEKIIIPTNNKNKILTIEGLYENKPALLSRGVLGEIFTVSSGARVVLEDLIIDGKNSDTYAKDGGGPLININKDGKLLLSKNAKLQNNNNSISGGVFNSGLLIIDGGSITNCNADIGGGVYNNGEMIFTRGNITECTAVNLGGGICSNGKLNINGGVIRSCSAVYGGGVFHHPLNGSRNANPSISIEPFIFRSGQIVDCAAKLLGGGIYNSSDTYVLGGTISRCTAMRGGGIHSDGYYGSNTTGDKEYVARLFLISATISGCTAVIDESIQEGGQGTGGGIYNTAKMYSIHEEVIDCSSEDGRLPVISEGMHYYYKVMTKEELINLFPEVIEILKTPDYSTYDYYNSTVPNINDTIQIPNVCWNTPTYARNAIKDLPIVIVEIREIYAPQVTPGMIIGQWPIPGETEYPSEVSKIGLCIYVSTN